MARVFQLGVYFVAICCVVIEGNTSNSKNVIENSSENEAYDKSTLIQLDINSDNMENFTSSTYKTLLDEIDTDVNLVDIEQSEQVTAAKEETDKAAEQEKDKFLVELAKRILDVRKQGYSKTSYIIHPNKPEQHMSLPYVSTSTDRNSNYRKIKDDLSTHDRMNHLKAFAMKGSPLNEVIEQKNITEDTSTTTSVPPVRSDSEISSPSPGSFRIPSDLTLLQPQPENEPLVTSLVSQLKDILGNASLNSTVKVSSVQSTPIASTDEVTASSVGVEANEITSSTDVTETTAVTHRASSTSPSMTGNTIQDEVTSFLNSVASSSGFQNAFVGDLIKSFSSLNHNGLNLLYNLLIDPLKNSPSPVSFKADEEEKKSDFNYFPESIMTAFSGAGKTPKPKPAINSVLIKNENVKFTEDDWSPFRSSARSSRAGLDIEVITALPVNKFELVVGSSFHPEPVETGRFQQRSGVPFLGNLKMGMHMPPADALDALPPGAQLILPSQIENKPVLPQIGLTTDNIPVPILHGVSPNRPNRNSASSGINNKKNLASSEDVDSSSLSPFSAIPNFFASLFSRPSTRVDSNRKPEGLVRRRHRPPLHKSQRDTPNLMRKRQRHRNSQLNPAFYPRVPQPPPHFINRGPLQNPSPLSKITHRHITNVQNTETLFERNDDVVESDIDRYHPSSAHHHKEDSYVPEDDAPIGYFHGPTLLGGFTPLQKHEDNQLPLSSHFAVRHQLVEPELQGKIDSSYDRQNSNYDSHNSNYDHHPNSYDSNNNINRFISSDNRKRDPTVDSDTNFSGNDHRYIRLPNRNVRVRIPDSFLHNGQRQSENTDLPQRDYSMKVQNVLVRNYSQNSISNATTLKAVPIILDISDQQQYEVSQPHFSSWDGKFENADTEDQIELRDQSKDFLNLPKVPDVRQGERKYPSDYEINYYESSFKNRQEESPKESDRLSIIRLTPYHSSKEVIGKVNDSASSLPSDSNIIEDPNTGEQSKHDKEVNEFTYDYISESDHSRENIYTKADQLQEDKSSQDRISERNQFVNYYDYPHNDTNYYDYYDSIEDTKQKPTIRNSHSSKPYQEKENEQLPSNEYSYVAHAENETYYDYEAMYDQMENYYDDIDDADPNSSDTSVVQESETAQEEPVFGDKLHPSDHDLQDYSKEPIEKYTKEPESDMKERLTFDDTPMNSDYGYHSNDYATVISGKMPSDYALERDYYEASNENAEYPALVVSEMAPINNRNVVSRNVTRIFNHNHAKSNDYEPVDDIPIRDPVKPVDALTEIHLDQMFSFDVPKFDDMEEDLSQFANLHNDDVFIRVPEEESYQEASNDDTRGPDSSATYHLNTIDEAPRLADSFNTKQVVDANTNNIVLNSSEDKYNYNYTIGQVNEVVEDSPPAEEFMAYVLIGSCVGLAMLSITGVLLIIKFKQSCGSRQIQSRQRLKKGSLPDVSPIPESFLESDNGGHKLGSWFTAKGGTFGSGKMRSNMALPGVDDLRRDHPERSSSRRDLLSSASNASGTDSQRSKSSDDKSVSANEKSRDSWLHKEFNGSETDLTGKKRKSFHGREKSLATEKNSHKQASSDNRHMMMSQDTDLSPKSEGEFYTTDSEFYDPTSAGEDGRSTHFGGDESQELESIKKRRAAARSVTTSQELGEKLSHDIRHFHSNSRHMTSRGSTLDRDRKHYDDDGNHLRRTSSEASFTRDNVQNEVFLEFDNIFKQHGQYLTASDGQQSSLERTTDRRQHGRRSNSPDSIEAKKSQDRKRSSDSPSSNKHHHYRTRSSSTSGTKPAAATAGIKSPPTPPRFTPPPPPPRPPKPDRLTKASSPSGDPNHKDSA